MRNLTYITIWLMTVSIMDIRSRKISIWLLLSGGILVLATCGNQFAAGSLALYDILRGMVPGLLLLAIAFVTKKAGYGDGMVLVLVGMVVGGGKSFVIFGVSLFLISVFSIILLLFRKVRRNSTIPYLPFLTAAWLLI
ncbi:MAG: hypothetical protein HFH82_13560 [Lachnospiraceae bacterium]|nr:hypothetical protein [Lachnospiraceae bacterium]